MSKVLKLLVLHRHESYYPGDTIELSEERYLKATAEHPFPYYHVLEGAKPSVFGEALAKPAVEEPTALTVEPEPEPEPILVVESEEELAEEAVVEVEETADEDEDQTKEVEKTTEKKKKKK